MLKQYFVYMIIIYCSSCTLDQEQTSPNDMHSDKDQALLQQTDSLMQHQNSNDTAGTAGIDNSDQDHDFTACGEAAGVIYGGIMTRTDLGIEDQAILLQQDQSSSNDLQVGDTYAPDME